MEVEETTHARTTPPPKRAWRGWFLISLLLGMAVCLSVGLNILLGIAVVSKDKAESAGSISLKGYSSHLVDGEAESKEFIAVVPVQGMIMEMPSEDGEGKGSLSRMRRLLKELKKPANLKNLKGILLQIDSPGGGVTTSDLMYHELSEFKKETGLPVVALFQDLAASGGYYVAMASDHIIAHETTLTGSIGVISQFYNVADLMGKVGVKVNTVKSLNFEHKESFKDIGSPYRPMRASEQKIFQDLVTEMWQRFTHVVAEGRKGKLTLEEVQKLADGRVYTGPQALKLKLVDSVGYPSDAYAKIRELAKTPGAKIVSFSREKGWEELFSAQTKPPALSMIEKIMGNSDEPRMLYMWDGR